MPSYYSRFELPPDIKLFDFNVDLLVVVGACFFSFVNQPLFVTVISRCATSHLRLAARSAD
jgi:hypothetical protein